MYSQETHTLVKPGFSPKEISSSTSSTKENGNADIVTPQLLSCVYDMTEVRHMIQGITSQCKLIAYEEKRTTIVPPFSSPPPTTTTTDS